MSPTNEEIARVLDEVALLPERQAARPFRVRAYRRAARTVAAEGRSVARIARREGRRGLRHLRGVGPGLAALIEEFVSTGRLRLRDRLRRHFG